MDKAVTDAVLTRPAERLTTGRFRLLAALVGALVVATSVDGPASAAPVATAIGETTIEVSAPEIVRAGASATIEVSTDPAYTGTGRVWYRDDDVWHSSSIVVSLADGTGSVSWKPTSSRQYYVELDDGSQSDPFDVSVEDSARRAITVEFTASDIASGEMVWLKGVTTLYGSPWGGARLTLQRKPMGSGSWADVGSTKSRYDGGFTYRFTPTSRYVYRVRLTGTSTYSAPATIDVHVGGRTLEEREADMAWLLGDATGSVHPIAASDLPSSVTSARYRTYSRGLLVEVVMPTSTRTWYVYDRVGEKYAKLGRWEGRLGLPVRDMRCGFLEGGCVQRYRGGSIYMNRAAMSPSEYVAYGAMPETEILAVAYSQVGYEEPSWQRNKYTSWMGAREPWCMMFVAWSAAAAGHHTEVPRARTYAEYVKKMQASGRLHYSGTPPAGAVVLFDWGTGTPTHTAFVTSRVGSYIYTIEGNTTDGSGDPQRGVYHRKRPLSYVWAWYMPSDH